MEKIRYPEPVDFSLYKKDSKDLHAKYGLPKETMLFNTQMGSASMSPHRSTLFQVSAVHKTRS